MSGYLFPKISDEITFENFCCDLLKIIFKDNSFQLYGKKGSTQQGLDGLNFNSNNTIYFQSKHKSGQGTEYKQKKYQSELLVEIEEEFNQAYKRIEESKFENKNWKFILLSTYSKTTSLQSKAEELTKSNQNKNIQVEYWGWEDISEKLSDIYLGENIEFFEKYYANLSEYLSANKYVKFIKEETYNKFKTSNTNELLETSREFYKISNRHKLLLKVIVNNLEIKDDKFIKENIEKIENIPINSAVWILQNGGMGKTTFLHRLMYEFSTKGKDIFYLNFEDNLDKSIIINILEFINKKTNDTYLFIDNSYQKYELLNTFYENIQDYNFKYKVILSERGNRFNEIKNSSTPYIPYHSQENKAIIIENSEKLKFKILDKSISLLGIKSTQEIENIKNTFIDKNIGIVESIYRMYLELKNRGKINYVFDWQEFDNILQKNNLNKYKGMYSYLSLLYMFGLKSPFSILKKIYTIDEQESKKFIEVFNSNEEPIIIDSLKGKKIGYGKYSYNHFIKPKHEIIAELYFEELNYNEEKKNELLGNILDVIDFSNTDESNLLIWFLGNKKNIVSDSFLDFDELYEYIFEKDDIKTNEKLYQTLCLSKFWYLLKICEDEKKEYMSAKEILFKCISLKKDDLHPRTELAKVYQVQKKYDEAEEVLKESLEIDNKQLHP
uniref:P-loop NTPase n=1 Tax=Halarcobacter sp. TaxID=2321133 RepID=UPI003A92001A